LKSLSFWQEAKRLEIRLFLHILAKPAFKSPKDWHKLAQRF